MEKIKLIDVVLLLTMLIVITLLIINLFLIKRTGLEVIKNPLVYGVKQAEKDYGLSNLTCSCHSPDMRVGSLFVSDLSIEERYYG